MNRKMEMAYEVVRQASCGRKDDEMREKESINEGIPRNGHTREEKLNEKALKKAIRQDIVSLTKQEEYHDGRGRSEGGTWEERGRREEGRRR